MHPTKVHGPRVSRRLPYPGGNERLRPFTRTQIHAETQLHDLFTFGKTESASGAPAYQCQTSMESIRCHREISPAASKK